MLSKFIRSHNHSFLIHRFWDCIHEHFNEPIYLWVPFTLLVFGFDPWMRFLSVEISHEMASHRVWQPIKVSHHHHLQFTELPLSYHFLHILYDKKNITKNAIEKFRPIGAMLKRRLNFFVILVKWGEMEKIWASFERKKSKYDIGNVHWEICFRNENVFGRFCIEIDAIPLFQVLIQ